MKGGTGPGLKRMKDAAMAARLKEEKVRRMSQRCPVCYRITALAGFYGHISTLCRGSRYEDKAT